MARPSDNPVVQRMQVLLSGTGFNYYGDVNKARADDLLVRQSASGRLTAAAAALTRLESDFRRDFVPPSTRLQLFPPAETMQALRAIAALKTRIGDLDSRLRGASAPAQDKIWWRVRDEAQTLSALLSFDRLLIEQADLAQQTAESLTASRWNTGEDRAALDGPLSEFESTLALRNGLLRAS